MQQKQELTFTTKITAPTHIRSSDMSGAQRCKLHFHYWSSFQHRGAWACVLQHDTIHTCTCFLQLFLFSPHCQWNRPWFRSNLLSKLNNKPPSTVQQPASASLLHAKSRGAGRAPFLLWPGKEHWTGCFTSVLHRLHPLSLFPIQL